MQIDIVVRQHAYAHKTPNTKMGHTIIITSDAGVSAFDNKTRPHQHLEGRTKSIQKIPKTITQFIGWEGRLKAMVLRH
jgi:hypothetical protein